MKRILGLTVAILSLLAATPVAAATSTQTATFTVQPGALSLANITGITDQSNIVALNGTAETVDMQWQSSVGNNLLSVTDATGSGSGWHVTIGASQLTEVTPPGGWASGTSALTLPLDSTVVAVSGAQTAAGSGATQVSGTGGPSFTSNGSMAIDEGAIPVTLVDTQPGYGMGQYLFSFSTYPIVVNLQPSSTFVDGKNYPGQPTPYATTITFTVVSGP